MKASEFKALSFLEQVKAYVAQSRLEVEVEPIDPGILSDFGTEGIVFDQYVVYLAKGEYEFDSIKILGRSLPQMAEGYYVWSEVQTSATRDTPPESEPNDLLYTKSLAEAVAKCLEVVVASRIEHFSDVLADSDAEEAEEEYDNALKGGA